MTASTRSPSTPPAATPIRGVYYYTTYDNNQITAVSMHHEDLDGVALVHYPIIQKQNIFCQN